MYLIVSFYLAGQGRSVFDRNLQDKIWFFFFRLAICFYKGDSDGYLYQIFCLIVVCCISLQSFIVKRFDLRKLYYVLTF